MKYEQLSEAQYNLLIKLALEFNAGIVALTTVWKDGDKERFYKMYKMLVNEYNNAIEKAIREAER